MYGSPSTLVQMGKVLVVVRKKYELFEKLPVVQNARLIKTCDGGVPRGEVLSVNSQGFHRALPRRCTLSSR